VQPAAVEAVLRAADGVRDAVVLGLPHPRLGELVVAVIDGDINLAAVRRDARLRLAAAQLPRRWYAVEAMPRTGTGKPARGELLAAVQDGTLRPLQVTASRVDQIEERWNQRFPSTLENHGPQHQE
jgi:long-chain acyl-CoA synthetase